MNSNALSLFERHFVVIAAFEIDRSWIRRTMMMVFVYFIVQFEISRFETTLKILVFRVLVSKKKLVAKRKKKKEFSRSLDILYERKKNVSVKINYHEYEKHKQG